VCRDASDGGLRARFGGEYDEATGGTSGNAGQFERACAQLGALALQANLLRLRLERHVTSIPAAVSAMK
jgi:hypothetical protein